MAISEGKSGPQVLGDSAQATLRIDKSGALVNTDGHARFQEAVYRGGVYSAGMTTTSISNVTFTTATLSATGTPIIGVWNPTGSGKNLVIWQAKLQIVQTAATSTGGGTFVWAISTGNGVISTGITPTSHLTLAASGSVAKGFAGTALTGITNNPTVLGAAGIAGGPVGNFSEVGTAVGFVPDSLAQVENLDGSIIVPPGGFVGLFCTTTPVALSAASSIVWEEIAV